MLGTVWVLCCQSGKVIIMVAERDDHWMLEIYTGEMIPEVVMKKNIAHKKAIEIRERMKKVYRTKKHQYKME